MFENFVTFSLVQGPSELEASWASQLLRVASWQIPTLNSHLAMRLEQVGKLRVEMGNLTHMSGPGAGRYRYGQE